MSRTQIVTKDIQDSLEVNCVIFAGLDKKAKWQKLVDILPPTTPPIGDGLALTTIAVTLNGVTYVAGTLIDSILNDIGNLEEEAVLIGTVNNINKVFTLAHTPIPKSINIFLNGQRLKRNVDYFVVGNQITFVDAIYTTDYVTTEYKYS